MTKIMGTFYVDQLVNLAVGYGGCIVALLAFVVFNILADPHRSTAETLRRVGRMMAAGLKV